MMRTARSRWMEVPDRTGESNDDERESCGGSVAGRNVGGAAAGTGAEGISGNTGPGEGAAQPGHQHGAGDQYGGSELQEGPWSVCQLGDAAGQRRLHGDGNEVGSGSVPDGSARDV